MSTFNIVRCNYNLPKPESPRGFVVAAIFQTQDLGEGMKSFEIKEDGTLWLNQSQYESQNLIREWQEKQDVTKVIKIYNNQPNEIGEFDYSINYSLSFVKGVVSEVKLISFNADSNSGRKQNIKDAKEEVKADALFVKSWSYRYFFKHWKRLVSGARSLFFKIGKKITNLSFKL